MADEYDVILRSWQPRIDGIIRACYRKLGWQPTSDLADDCRSEAALANWRALPRAAELSGAERDAYIVRSIQRAVWEVLLDEQPEVSGQLRLEALAADDLRHAGLAAADPLAQDCCGTGCLLDQISDPELARLVRSLPADDCRVLELWCAGESFRSIAGAVGSTPDAVRMRLKRCIERINGRLVIRQGAGGG